MSNRKKIESEKNDYLKQIEEKNKNIEILKSKNDFYKLKIDLYKKKIDKLVLLNEVIKMKYERGIESASYKIGYLLLHEIKSIKSLVLLPKRILSIRKEAIRRQDNIKSISTNKNLINNDEPLSVNLFLKKIKEMMSEDGNNLEIFIDHFMINNLNDNDYICKKLFMLLKDTHVDIAVKYGKFYADNNMNDTAFVKIFAFRLNRLHKIEEAYFYFKKVFSIINDEQVHQEILVFENKNQISNWIFLAKNKQLEMLNKEVNKLIQENKGYEERIYKLIGNVLTEVDLDLSIEYIKKAIHIQPSDILNLKLFDLYIRKGNLSEAITNISVNMNNDTAILKKSRWLENFNLIKEDFPFPIKNAKKVNIKCEKKIFYLLHNTLPYHSGGYATRAQGLMEGINNLNNFSMIGLSRLGYPKDILKLASFKNINDSENVENVQYNRLKSEMRPGNTSYIEYVENYAKAVCQIAKKEKPFIIHAASNFYNGLAAVYSAKLLGLKSIYEIRGLWEITRISREPEFEKTELYQLNTKLETEAAKNADIVLTITQALKNEMIERGVDAKKIEILPNGVDTDRFIPVEKNTDLLRLLKIENKVVIGYIGSIVQYEGLDYLVKAVELLIKKSIKNIVILIVGDGAALDSIKELVTKFSLSKYFIFTGRVPHDEVEKYYSIVDIAPFPRKGLPVTEMVSPLKPFEAMSMEKAVISSNVAALEEIVEDYSNGLLFEKDNIEDFSKKLAILINDAKLRNSLGKQARIWVKKERDWRIIAKKLNEIYQKVYNEY